MQESSANTVYSLVCHPLSSSQSVEAIEVKVDWLESGALKLVYTLTGGVSHLVIPDYSQSRRGSELWKHTCFEVFVMAGSGPGYREYNFSPSGEWAAYDFRAYRDGGEFDVELDPCIEVRTDRHRLELDVEVSRELLPKGQSLRMGLSAVIEDADGHLSFWALRHPAGKPDFHHADTFALEYGFRISISLRPE